MKKKFVRLKNIIKFNDEVSKKAQQQNIRKQNN